MKPNNKKLIKNPLKNQTLHLMLLKKAKLFISTIKATIYQNISPILKLYLKNLWKNLLAIRKNL